MDEFNPMKFLKTVRLLAALYRVGAGDTPRPRLRRPAQRLRPHEV